MKTVDTLDELSTYERDWNDLLLRTVLPHPMAGYPWIASFIEHFVTGTSSWFCILAFDGARLVGVLPVIATPLRPPLHYIREYGLPANQHTLSVGMTVEPTLTVEVVDALIDVLRERSASSVPRTVFCRQPAGTITTRLRAGGDGFRVITKPDGAASYLRVPPDFRAYRDSLRRNFRHNLNKAAKKLDLLPGVRYVFLQDRDATEAGLQRFMTVERAGWKGRLGTAISCSESLTAFYRSVTAHLARAGWLEWHFLEANGVTISAHLAMRCRRHLLLWKIGYDESFARCSPGSMLFEQLVRRRSESGDVDEINLLTHHVWHKHWSADQRHLHRLTLYNRRSAFGTIWYLGERAATLARRLPGVRRVKTTVRQWLAPDGPPPS